MNNNSGLVNINNCNSLDISVVSSPTVNSIRRNSFYKLTNVLLLLFLVFGSSVVSFGMNVNEEKKEEKKENENENELNDDQQDKNKPSVCKNLLLAFAPGLITGIGGYDNTWKPLKWGLYWYRHNIYSISIIDNILEKLLSFGDKIPIFGTLNRLFWPFLMGGVNYHVPFKFPFTNFDMDLHIFGFNHLATFENVLLAFVGISTSRISYHKLQFFDLEIKVAKYYSISINMIYPLVVMCFVDNIISHIRSHIISHIISQAP